MDLGIADRHLDRGMPELAKDRLGSRATLALPGGRSAGRLHRRGVFSPGLAALGLDRARVALSDPGEQVGGATRKTPRVDSPAACRLRRLFPGDSGVAIGEYRYGWLQRDGRGGWGLVDTRTDPTLDLYGWDQVADRIKQLGLLDDPRTFVFTSYWYQSAHLAHALGRERPVLCYNADDPRGFAFWSRPEEWIGRDGILVVVGEIESWPRYFRRWFGSVEPVSDFWVERNGKPVRRIQLYRCLQQRVAFPFAMDRAERLARSPRKAAALGGPWHVDIAHSRDFLVSLRCP